MFSSGGRNLRPWSGVWKCATEKYQVCKQSQIDYLVFRNFSNFSYFALHFWAENFRDFFFLARLAECGEGGLQCPSLWLRLRSVARDLDIHNAPQWTVSACKLAFFSLQKWYYIKRNIKHCERSFFYLVLEKMSRKYPPLVSSSFRKATDYFTYTPGDTSSGDWLRPETTNIKQGTIFSLCPLGHQT